MTRPRSDTRHQGVGVTIQDGELVAGRYRLGAKVGSGAMGVVWQASDERLHRTVALKQLLLPAGLPPAEAEAARGRAMREGRIAARLQHPGAITVYDVVGHQGQPWLVMEYLPARSLADLLAQHGALPPERAAAIGAEAARALAAAHAKGVVHRDVKPANILLGDDGTVKITDFGISRASGDVTLTTTGMLAGTPAYLAPETARGEDPSAPSDVFSLGSTLYAAVEGKPPFTTSSENPLAMLHAVAAGQFAPPQQAGRLTALLMRLMRVEPAQRPSMAQAGSALADVSQGRTVSATALEPAPQQAPRPPQQAQPPARPRDTGDADAREPTRARQTAAPAAPTRTWRQPQRPARAVATTEPPARPTATARTRTTQLRSIALAVLAVVLAAAVGVGVASLLMSGA